MKTAAAEKPTTAGDSIGIKRAEPGPIFFVRDRAVYIRRMVTIVIGGVAVELPDDDLVALPALQAGSDYFIRREQNAWVATLADSAGLDDVIGGFHFAPGGNATTRSGGDETPTINPFSIWDRGYRPACLDPRSMTCVDGKFWCDIYLLGTSPFEDGTSKFGATIADGKTPPAKKQTGRYSKLDQPTAIEIYAAAGKSLLSPEEFFAAALGVTEGTSFGDDPQTTQLDAPRTSKWGVMQATGNMSIWGTDGDPDGQRQAWRFGGDWDTGEFAGSRFALVDYWPDYSGEWIGARGRSDHLQPDA